MTSNMPRTEEVRFEPIPDSELPEEILEAKDPDETILWFGQPENWLPYQMSIGLWIQVYACGAISIFIWYADYSPVIKWWDSGVIVYCIGLWFLFMLYGSTVTMNNSYYAISDRRVMMLGRLLLGDDFQSVDHSEISDVSISRSWYDRWYGTGDVKFSRICFFAIKNHTLIGRLSKKLIIDVKTDWEYPNIKRVETNPGYKTKLTNVTRHKKR